MISVLSSHYDGIKEGQAWDEIFNAFHIIFEDKLWKMLKGKILSPYTFNKGQNSTLQRVYCEKLSQLRKVQ